MKGASTGTVLSISGSLLLDSGLLIANIVLLSYNWNIFIPMEASKAIMKNANAVARIDNLKKALPFLLIALALAARLLPGSRPVDDSFITYRYARNILSGSGFVYNPGERVMGTTTPLFTFLMVALGSLTGGANAPFPYLSMGVNMLADAATCVLLWQLGKRAGSELAGAAAGLVWAIAPFSVTFAIGGMETSVVVFLMTAAVYTFVVRRYTLTGLFAILALLTRPDTILLVGPLFLDRSIRAFRGEKPRWSEVLVFFLPGLAWLAFSTWYFGTPIPHSVTAKLQVYLLEPASSLTRLMQHYATPFLEYNTLGAPLAVGIGIILYPFLYLVGALKAWRNERRLLVYMIYPWLYLLVFSLPNPLIFRWYMTPPLPPYFLFILIGMEKILRDLFAFRFGRKTANPRPNAPWRVWIPALMVLLIPFSSSLTEWRLHPDHGPDRPAPEMAWFKLELLYMQAAKEIAPLMDSNTVLAAGDVGALGYFTPARILDTVGLNSPQSLKYYPIDPSLYANNYAVPSELILGEKPDWVVLLDVAIRKTAMVDPRIWQAYELYDAIPTDIYDSQNLVILRKKG